MCAGVWGRVCWVPSKPQSGFVAAAEFLEALVLETSSAASAVHGSLGRACLETRHNTHTHTHTPFFGPLTPSHTHTLTSLFSCESSQQLVEDVEVLFILSCVHNSCLYQRQ